MYHIDYSITTTFVVLIFYRPIQKHFQHLSTYQFIIITMIFRNILQRRTADDRSAGSPFAFRIPPRARAGQRRRGGGGGRETIATGRTLISLQPQARADVDVVGSLGMEFNGFRLLARMFPCFDTSAELAEALVPCLCAPASDRVGRGSIVSCDN